MTTEKLYNVCNRYQWFTCGSTKQYERLFELNKAGASLDKLATIIWICSDEMYSEEDILAALKYEDDEKTINKNVKNVNVDIEDNGAAFLVVINKGTEQRLVVNSFKTLGDAWRHIVWMYKIESQKFTVGNKKIPVTEWIAKMKDLGYLD